MASQQQDASRNIVQVPLWRRAKQRAGAILVRILPLNRHVFDHIRGELNGWYVRVQNKVNPLYRSRQAKLRRSSNLAVNIGSGASGKPGWVNLDLMGHTNVSLRYDCRRSLPLSDASAKYLRCEHFLEHLDILEEVPPFLGSCYRVLCPGGILRIVVPDAEKYLRAYTSDTGKAWDELGWDFTDLPQGFYTGLDVINHVFRQGHEHMYAYDFETLAQGFAPQASRTATK